MAPGSSLSQPRDPAVGSECRFWDSFLCLGTAIRWPAVFVSTLVLPKSYYPDCCGRVETLPAEHCLLGLS